MRPMTSKAEALCRHRHWLPLARDACFWKANGRGRAATQRAFNHKSAAVQLGEALRDDQPQARAVVAPREPVVCLHEGLANTRHVLGRHPNAGVAHENGDTAVNGPPRADGDPTIPIRELQSVREEIENGLNQ